MIYTIEQLKERIAPVASKYRLPAVYLFGSYARGEQNTTSDVDFLIDKGSIEGLEFFGFVNNLEDDLGVHVDVLTYDALKDSMIADAVKDEVVLYEG